MKEDIIISNNQANSQDKLKLKIIACSDVCGDGKDPSTMDYHCGFYSPQIGPVVKALAKKGIELIAVDWQKQQNWKQTKLILGPVWKYHLKIDKFLDFINGLEKQNIVMVNHPKFIKWNAIKSYLLDLQKYQISTPNTLYFDQTYKNNVKQALEQFNQKYGKCNVIIKGAVDANGQTYIHLNQQNIQTISKHFQYLQQHQKGVIMQRFIPELMAKGQFSFVYFGSKFSHFYLKVPSKGEQRVQYRYGGKNYQIKADLSDAGQKLAEIKHNFRHDFQLSVQDVKSALKQVNELQQKLKQMFINLQIQFPRYLRIDCVLVEDKITIMQLEGIQPYLALTEAMENDPNNDTIANYIEGVVQYLL